LALFLPFLTNQPGWWLLLAPLFNSYSCCVLGAYRPCYSPQLPLVRKKTATSTQVVVRSLSKRCWLHFTYSWGQSEGWVNAQALWVEVPSFSGT
jgi:hypothetical protein